MAMDTKLPKIALEQEQAEEIVHAYAKNFKDVAYTDPASGKTGFTAYTPDGHFVVEFGFDDAHPGRPGWYYSASATEDYSHGAKGSGMARSAQAMHLLKKVVSGDTWYKKHAAGEHENDKEQKRHEIKEGGMISEHKDKDGDYEVIAS